MSTASGFYSIREIEEAVEHLKQHGRQNRQAEENPDLAGLAEELREARQRKDEEGKI